MECWWCLGQSGVLVVSRTEWSAGEVGVDHTEHV